MEHGVLCIHVGAFSDNTHRVVLHQILNTWSIVDLNAERVPTRHITKKTHMSTLTNNKKFTRRHHCLFVYVVIINIRIFVALFGLSLNELSIDCLLVD